ncbi:MAG: hypothetical protein GX958_00875 [Desulfitobacterium sp.]|nr:hypothetical protein [Desulfitobacterium sp.]
MNTSRNISKIVLYDLEQDTVNLRQAGLSYQRIADELNALGKVPEDDQINADIVKRFLDHIPAVSREMVKRDQKKMMAVVNNNMDIIHEMTTLYGKTADLLSAMENQAQEEGNILDPHKFKALSSEMREMLKMMIEIQRELNDYENTRKFMEIVMETVAEECPQSIPLIIEKLKMSQETQWIGQMFNRRS